MTLDGGRVTGGPSSMGRLDGKVALISGTGRGMGRTAALLFAGLGAKVVGCDLDASSADETVQLATAAGGEMVSLAPVDLSNQDGADRWVQTALDAHGRVDILYNNASALRHGAVATIPIDDWYFTIQNELHLVFHCTRAAWPHLVASKGCVLNVASIAATHGVDFVPMASHGAAKGGVLSFTKHLVAEGAGLGVRANVISPGMIRTPETAQFLDLPGHPLHRVLAATPSRRPGETDEVAKLAAFLCSDDAAYINGAVVAIDGGKSAID
jgi:meso-butanediol dehydrogenase / (S,S)-butanediol dehydrogenase / diacetyl reductase